MVRAVLTGELSGTINGLREIPRRFINRLTSHQHMINQIESIIIINSN